LDAPLTSDAESSLIDVLEDTNSKGADDQLLNQGIQREIRELISTLSPRDAEIIRRSFGIDGPEVSIDDIALEFNLTRERVRQIREQSIKRLQTRAKQVLSLD
jgi:RNA polymerase primary sigma factor